MRFGERAVVEEWLNTVAQVLPLPPQSDLPYTVMDAVCEYRDWARSIRPGDWGQGSSRQTRSSLQAELRAQMDVLGPRLTGRFATQIEHLIAAISHADVSQVADEFTKSWSAEATVSDAFADLCEAAQGPRITTSRLRELADVIASRIGPAARGGISTLTSAAEALIASEEDLAQSHPLPATFGDAARVEMAEATLLTEPRGHVVVWLVYSRAITEFRLVAGPITFFAADWALQVAFGEGPNNFPEAVELRTMRPDVFWIESAEEATQDPRSRLALVRVDLGERLAAGAIEDARTRVEALLSIAVEAGGVSWRDAGGSAALVDGEVRMSSPFLVLDGRVTGDDTYGMAATSEVMKNAVNQLGEALSRRQMPEQLVEALGALRQARMTDHRDVSFYDAEAVSPRVATALEDHAMEQLAAGLGVHSRLLADAVQDHRTLALADERVARGLTAPFEQQWASDDRAEHKRIEHEVVDYTSGRRTVSIRRVVEHAEEIRALPMSSLQRADFEYALQVVTDPAREREELTQLRNVTTVLRARHRRVRNAVNHGLPLGNSTLYSVRDYAERTSTDALHIALSSFKSDKPGQMLVSAHSQPWLDRGTRLEEGVSWLDGETRVNDKETTATAQCRGVHDLEGPTRPASDGA